MRKTNLHWQNFCLQENVAENLVYEKMLESTKGLMYAGLCVHEACIHACGCMCGCMYILSVHTQAVLHEAHLGRA